MQCDGWTVGVTDWYASGLPPSEQNSERWHHSAANSRCWYQSVTHCLNRCSIEDANNYVFRPIAATIRLSSESMLVVIYRIGIVTSRWWYLNICQKYTACNTHEPFSMLCDVSFYNNFVFPNYLINSTMLGGELLNKNVNFDICLKYFDSKKKWDR